VNSSLKSLRIKLLSVLAAFSMIIATSSAFAAVDVKVGGSANAELVQGTNNTVDVTFSASESNILSMDFFLVYDPAVLRVTGLTPGIATGIKYTDHSNIGQKPTNATPGYASIPQADGTKNAEDIGYVKYTVYEAVTGGDPTTDGGELFTFHFDVIGTGTTQVSLVNVPPLTSIFTDGGGTAMDSLIINPVTITVSMTDAGAVAADKDELDLGDLSNVTTDLDLHNAGTNGTTITWASTNTSVIATNGTVTRPSFTTGDATVTLTATIKKGTVTDTKSFEAFVPKLAATDAEAVAADKLALNVAGDLSNVTADLTLPGTGTNGTTITWASSNTAVIANNGTVTQPSFTDGDAEVTLTATIEKNGEQDTKEFIVTVKRKAATDIEAVALDKDALGIAGDLANVTGDLTLPTTGANGSTITWASDNAAIASNGTVIRPAFADGDAAVTLTATIKRGAVEDTKTFTATVLKLAATDADAVVGAIAALNLGDTSAVKTNITLPTTGANETTITWSSSNTSAISNAGVVTRPAYGFGDSNVTLTATVKKNAATDTKTFTAIVKERQDGITSFEIAGVGTGVISHADKTINLSSSAYVDVTDIAATFTLPAGTTATLADDSAIVSEVTQLDFSAPVSIKVKDADGNETTYTVTVEVGKQFEVAATKAVVGNRVYINATATNHGANKDAVLIIAVYETSSATDMKFFVYKEGTLGATTDLDAGFLLPTGNYVVKAFVWDNFTSGKALSDAEVIN